jgi:hypothetical protein
MNKTTLITEFESVQELAEYLEYIKKAALGFETEHNLITELNWFFDAKPKATPSQTIKFIKEFIKKHL